MNGRNLVYRTVWQISVASKSRRPDRDTRYRKIFLYNSFPVIYNSGCEMQKSHLGLKKKKSPCYFSSNYVQYYEDTFQFVESITANTCWQSELKIQKLYFTVTAHDMSFKGLSFHPWCFSCGISFISIQIERALEGGKQKVGDRCQRLIWNSNIYFLFPCLIH